MFTKNKTNTRLEMLYSFFYLVNELDIWDKDIEGWLDLKWSVMDKYEHYYWGSTCGF